MADAGNTTTPANTDYPVNVDSGTISTIVIPSFPENGTMQSISWYGDTASGGTYYAAVYSAATSGNLLAEHSASYSPGALTGQWHTINRQAASGGSLSLSSGSTYVLAVGGSGTAGTIYEHSSTGSNTGQYDWYNFDGGAGVWDDPGTMTNGSAGYHPIYVTYTTGGGAVTAGVAGVNKGLINGPLINRGLIN